MARVLRFWLVVLGLALTVSAAFAANTGKRPDERPDPRLDQPISISTAYDSLEEFLPKLAALTAAGPAGESGHPVAITVDPVIRDHKVVVRVKEQPLREVMRQVAVLFDFTWAQGPQEHPRYHLMQSAARAKLARDLHKRYLAEREMRYRGLVKNAIKAARGAEELYEIAQVDPEAAVTATLFPEACGMLTALDESAIEALLNGQDLVIPWGELPSEAQDIVREGIRRALGNLYDAAPTGGRPLDPARLIYHRHEGLGFPWALIAYVDINLGAPEPRRMVEPLPNIQLRPPWAPWSGCASILADYEDHPQQREYLEQRYQRVRGLEAECGIDIVDRAGNEGAGAVPKWARPDSGRESPRPSGEMIPLEREPEETASDPTKASLPWKLPRLLSELAEQLDFNLVADCYWTRSTISGFRGRYGSRLSPAYPSFANAQSGYCLVDANPEYDLQRICEQYPYDWVKDGNFFRVRNLLWFVDDPQEVPASALNEWMRRTEREKHVSVEDYLWLASNLTAEHARNTSATSYRGHPDCSEGASPLGTASRIGGPPYYPLRIYGLLPAALQARAQAAGIDLGADLPDSLAHLVQEMLDELLPRKAVFADAQAAESRAAALAQARLWAGHRIESSHERWFCIELWSGQTPDWSVATDWWEAPGYIGGYGYPLPTVKPKLDAKGGDGADR